MTRDDTDSGAPTDPTADPAGGPAGAPAGRAADPSLDVAVVDLPAEPQAPPSRYDAVLARYTARMKRARVVYLAVVAVVVVAAVVVAMIVVSRGEISKATLRTVANPPASVALQTPSATLQQAWRSDDTTATGNPVWGGTVVTHDEHTVRGRNATTGEQTWSYTRSDRVVCDAVQTAGTTIAIFRHKGNCDQVTALDSGTGERKWTRTLFENGQAVLGRPAIEVNQYTIMLTTPTVIYAVDPASGIDRWVFGQQGCRIGSAVLGSAGALISQTCTAPDCADRKFCGAGPQLLLRDGNASRSDDDKANPDKITWNQLGNTDVPVSADEVISALRNDGTGLDVLDVTKGAVTSTLALEPAPAATGRIAHLATVRAELIHIGDVLYSLLLTGADLFWAAPSTTMAGVVAPDGAQTGVPDLSTAVVSVPTADGIAVLDGGTGKPTATYPVGAPPAGSSVFALGTGFVVAGPDTTVYR